MKKTYAIIRLLTFWQQAKIKRLEETVERLEAKIKRLEETVERLEDDIEITEEAYEVRGRTVEQQRRIIKELNRENLDLKAAIKELSKGRAVKREIFRHADGTAGRMSSEIREEY